MAVRLLFTYDGGTVQLVRRVRVDVVVRVPPTADRQGVYVDLRTASGQVLARVAARGALRVHREVFAEPPARRIARIPSASRGAFVVTLPVVPDVARIAVTQVGRDRRATTLAAFPWDA